jgi:hypothetical protein
MLMIHRVVPKQVRTFYQNHVESANQDSEASDHQHAGNKVFASDGSRDLSDRASALASATAHFHGALLQVHMPARG